jgi:phosphoglycerol transferase MdoB-like AlkP superfamily enzyme
MSTPARNELKTYVNALRTSDRAIGRLLEHFEHSPQKTMIVIVGDHRAPFQNSDEIYAASGCLTAPEAGSLPKARLIPLLIWSNFAPKGPDVVCSTNFLPTEILSRIGVEPTEFLRLNDALRSNLTVLSNTCIQTRNGDFLSEEVNRVPLTHWMHDYELLQYDILLGHRYFSEIEVGGPVQVQRAAHKHETRPASTLNGVRSGVRSSS